MLQNYKYFYFLQNGNIFIRQYLLLTTGVTALCPLQLYKVWYAMVPNMPERLLRY
jgi:hypothetical protein